MIWLRSWMPTFQYWFYSDQFASALAECVEHFRGRTCLPPGWIIFFSTHKVAVTMVALADDTHSQEFYQAEAPF